MTTGLAGLIMLGGLIVSGTPLAFAQVCKVGPGSVIDDGSFERGIVSSGWARFSSVGSPVVCGPNCAAPNYSRSGDWWVWFGFSATLVGEVASIEQTVTIPVGHDTLSFNLYVSVRSGNTTDNLRVLIDGNPLRTFLESEPLYWRYTPVDIDVAAYADGNPHVLRFESEVSGLPNETAYFIDDVALCADPCTQLSPEPVADPGLEGGTPSVVWAEASTNFGTPLCDSVTCLFEPSASSGDWWAWFGGIAAPEIGSIEQTVIIPIDATTLSFDLMISDRSDNDVDFLRVLLDGANLFEVLENTPGYVGYTTVDIDLRTYADGGPHTLRLESEIAGAPTFSNFFVDDLSIRTCGPGVTCPPRVDTLLAIKADSTCLAPGTDRVSLTWTAVANANGYKVYRTEDPTVLVNPGSRGATEVTPCDDAVSGPPNLYFYSVIGLCSDLSDGPP